MSLLLLFLLTVASFTFYGVVGEDKSLLEGPVFILGYLLITTGLFSRAWSISRGTEKAGAGLGRSPVSSFLWLLFLGWSVAMIPFAAVSFDAQLAVLFVGLAVGAYQLWGGELTTFKTARFVLGVLIFIVMLTALYGLVNHFKDPSSVLWTERYTDHYLRGNPRLASTFICPNHFAHLLQMLLPFCLAVLFIPQSGIYLKLLSAYSFLAFMPPLFLTESRAGWLGAIVGVGIVVCLMALRRSKKLFAFLVILVPLCSVLLLVGAWTFSETFQRRMTPVVKTIRGQLSNDERSEPVDFRPMTWLDTLEMVKDAPLLGFGPGNYHYTFPEYRKRCKAARYVTGHPHNEYLELIADYGLIGFVVFAGAWLYGLFWVLIQSVKAKESRHAFLGFAFMGTVAGTMVHSFFDFQMHSLPNALVFALLAGIAVGPLLARCEKKKIRSDRKSVGKLLSSEEIIEAQISGPSKMFGTKAFSWAMAICFLVGTVYCSQVMSSIMLSHLGDRAAKAKESDKAKKLFQLAVRIDPENWHAYKGIARIVKDERYYCLDMEEKRQLAEIEREWFSKSYLHNSKDHESLVGLGKCLIFIGKKSDDVDLVEQGVGLLREACRYRRFNDQLWWTLGNELRKVGRYAESLEAFEQMETVKKTRSSRANILWLKKQIRNAVGPHAPEESKPVIPKPVFDVSESYDVTAEVMMLLDMIVE